MTTGHLKMAGEATVDTSSLSDTMASAQQNIGVTRA